MTERLEIEGRAQSAEREVAVLEDRQRIARDLHDRVIQRLFAAGLGLEATIGRVGDAAASDRLRGIVDDLDDTIRELRSSIFQLSNPSEVTSLRAMVIDVCTDERQALGFDPSLRFEGALDTVPDDQREALLAVLREALSNVARHAEATSARVTVSAAGALVVLRVEDDGIGVPDRPGGGGNGLANMRARATNLGGTCTITRATPTGTTLEWQVPLG